MPIVRQKDRIFTQWINPLERKDSENVRRRYYRCIHYGDLERPRKESTGCAWKVGICLVKRGGVQTYMSWPKSRVLVHSGHQLHPTRLISREKRFTVEETRRLETFAKSRLTAYQIAQIFRHEGCSTHSVKDISNFICRRFPELRSESNDAATFVKHLYTQAEREHDFYFDWYTGLGRTLSRAFFSYGSWRSLYANSNLCVGVDATYRTNRIGMSLVFFVGENCWGKTTTFGVGFLMDESLDSYIWLLEKFKECMLNIKPNLFISDHDLSIVGAIELVFPTTHRMECRWHFMKNVQENLAGSLGKEDLANFKKDLSLLIKHGKRESIRELFRIMCEEQYVGLRLHSYREWIAKRLVVLAECFAPLKFIGTMRTTGRNESRNRALKSLMRTSNASLSGIMQHIHLYERMRRDDDTNGSPSLVRLLIPGLSCRVPKHTSRIIAEEQRKSFDYEAIRIDEFSFVVKSSLSLTTSTVIINDEHDTKPVICSCGTSERYGVPCRHVLCVSRFVSLDINTCLHEYWKKPSMSGSIYDCLECDDILSDDDPFISPTEQPQPRQLDARKKQLVRKRYTTLLAKGKRLFDTCSKTASKFSMLVNALNKLLVECDCSRCDVEEVENVINRHQRGRPKKLRKRSSLESSIRRTEKPSSSRQRFQESVEIPDTIDVLKSADVEAETTVIVVPRSVARRARRKPEMFGGNADWID